MTPTEERDSRIAEMCDRVVNGIACPGCGLRVEPKWWPKHQASCTAYIRFAAEMLKLDAMRSALRSASLLPTKEE